jgi:hypothetical protein
MSGERTFICVFAALPFDVGLSGFRKFVTDRTGQKKTAAANRHGKKPHKTAFTGQTTQIETVEPFEDLSKYEVVEARATNFGARPKVDPA